jgi:hypothetical protein
MKNYKKYLLLISFFVFSFSAFAQSPAFQLSAPKKSNPWKQNELIEPAVLASQIKSGKAPILLNIGVAEEILGSKNLGAASDPQNLEKLKTELKNTPRNTPLVIYCGCCPFEKCPNIRPAFSLLKTLGFSHIELLDLPVNLQTNWVKLGYPVKK